MTVNVPGSDVQGTALQGQVTNLTTLAANNPNDIELGTALYQAQLALVQYLISTGGLVPGSVLALASYGSG